VYHYRVTRLCARSSRCRQRRMHYLPDIFTLTDWRFSPLRCRPPELPLELSVL
jgi:hypothetical protein